MPMSPRLLRPRQSGSGPRSIPNLALWLDAANSGSITLNGNNVSAWADLSSNSRDFSQATATAQPIGTRTYNGLRVLDFQGAQWLSGNAASLNIAKNVGALTMFVAGQFDTLAEYVAVLPPGEL